MVVSNIGTWMQMVAQGFLVYQLTHSPFALGLVGFVRAVPVFVFSLFAGVLADRVDRRKLLIVTQSLAGVLALVLGVLASTGVIQVWMIMVLAFLSASVMSFDNPTRQALIPDIVGKEYIANAVALNSAAFNGTGVLGPSLAGAAFGIVGVAACFYINAVSFIAVIIALFMMASVPNKSRSKRSMLANLRDGFKYVRGNRLVAALLIQIALISLLGRPYTQLMPAVQRDVLHVGCGRSRHADGLFRPRRIDRRADRGAVERLRASRPAPHLLHCGHEHRARRLCVLAGLCRLPDLARDSRLWRDHRDEYHEHDDSAWRAG